LSRSAEPFKTISEGDGKIYLGISNKGMEYSQNKKKQIKNRINIHPLKIHLINFFIFNITF